MIGDLAQKLHQASVKNPLSPYVGIEWPEKVPAESWYFSPEWISLEGTASFERLSEAEKKRLSFFECANFFTINIHGERALIQGLAERLYARPEVSVYLHDFLAEENNHMVYFGTFCERYLGKIYPDRKIAWPNTAERSPGEEDFLFFSKVMIFEEMVDVYNFSFSQDERLHPLVREINRRHHVEETRHLVFGREMVSDLYRRHEASWGDEKKKELADYLEAYLQSTWREYFNPDVYEDAGLTNAYDLAEEARESAAGQARFQKASQVALTQFKKIGLMP